MSVVEVVATVAVDYYKQRKEAENNEQQARELINAFGEKIEEARDEIINELHNQSLREFEGQIAGLGVNLKDYAAVPTRDLLNNTLSTSGQIVGGLVTFVEDNSLKYDIRKSAYLLYITTNSIRDIIWEEFKHKYATSQSEVQSIKNRIIDNINESLELTEKMIEITRKMVTGRFSELKYTRWDTHGQSHRHEGWYKFDNEKYLENRVWSSTKAEAISQAKANRKEHMNQLIDDYAQICVELKDSLHANLA